MSRFIITVVLLWATSGAICKLLQLEIDVSQFQGDIDWDRVGTDTYVRRVYVKGSDYFNGTRLADPQLVNNFRGVRKRSSFFSPMYVGYYHYFRTDTNGVKITVDEQVDFIRERMAEVDFDPKKDVFAVDVERTVGDPGISGGPDRLSNLECSSRLRALLLGVQATYKDKMRMVIYTQKSFWDPYCYSPEVDLNGIAKLWLTSPYSNQGANLTATMADINKTQYWPDPVLGFEKVHIWQFSNRFQIEGFTGPVDTNLAPTFEGW